MLIFVTWGNGIGIGCRDYIIFSFIKLNCFICKISIKYFVIFQALKYLIGKINDKDYVGILNIFIIQNDSMEILVDYMLSVQL